MCHDNVNRGAPHSDLDSKPRHPAKQPGDLRLVLSISGHASRITGSQRNYRKFDDVNIKLGIGSLPNEMR
jgi:hypothetical protein